MAVTAQQLYEQTLVVRCQLEDPAAFRELMRLHSTRLLAFVRKLMFPRYGQDLAEDLSQEIWVSIYRGLPALLDVTKFQSWIFRIARDRVYREFRRRKLPVEPLDDLAEQEMEANSEEPGSVFDSEQLQLCLASLSLGHREVLLLRYFEDMDYEEIARVTCTTLGTVRSRLHYAKRALKRVIEQTSNETPNL